MSIRSPSRSPSAPALALAAALVAALAVPSSVVGQLPQWRLGSEPLFEVGRGDGVLLHEVRDADILDDGSLLVGDNGSSSVLRVSPAGEVVQSFGRPGSGPGEFELIQRVFGRGDTIVAYDSPRVTIWLPGVPKPEVRSLPNLNGFSTQLKTVVSARVWVLTSFGHMSFDDDAGLREVRSNVFVFDAATGASRSAGSRLMNYDYLVVHTVGGHRATTTYRANYLGSAHVAATANRWLFVPMDDAVLEVWEPTGEAPERTVPLPVEQQPYRPDVGREMRDDWLPDTGRGGERGARIREMFDNLWEKELPPWAPPVGDAVEVGRHLWLQPFASDPEDEPPWLIVDPVAGVVRATVDVGPDLELLGGSEDAVAVLGRTELGEQFVQVRRIVRDG